MTVTREQIHRMLQNDDPSNAVTAWYNRVMTAIIVLSLAPLCFKQMTPVLWTLEAVCTAAFIVDYVLRWATADYKLGKGAASFALYPFTPMAIVDLVSILPTFIALNPSLRTVKILRLMRAVRAFKLVHRSRSFNIVVEAIKIQRDHLMVVAVLALAYVLGCALVMFNAEPETFSTFFDAIYWSVVSLTTVGYGDLYPTTDIGRAVAMVSSLVGIAVVAMPSSIITAGFMELLQEHDRGQGTGRGGDDRADMVDGRADEDGATAMEAARQAAARAASE